MRLVDKRKQNAGIRLELWFRSFKDKHLMNTLLLNMEKCLVDGYPAINGQPQVQFESKQFNLTVIR